MTSLLLISMALFISLPTSVTSKSEIMENPNNIGGWNIITKSSAKNKCVLQSPYQDGSIIQIEIGPDVGNVTVFNEKFGRITEGQKLPISLDLDSTKYTFDAKGTYLYKTPGANIIFKSDEFLYNMMNSYTMTLYHKKKRAISY